VVSDGFSSNMGAGAVDESAVAASVATSGAMRVLVYGIPDEIPSGLWCYRVDGSRSLLGGAVNDVGRVVSWLESTVRFQSEDDFNLILAAAPQASTPMVLPYFSGERSTSLAADARVVFAGVSAATTGAMLSRGAMEGVATLTPGSPDNCNQWPVNRNGSWQAAGTCRPGSRYSQTCARRLSFQ